MAEPSEVSIDTANQLHRSALRLFRFLRETQPPKGLTLSKFSVLGYLYRKGIATATELAVYLRVRPQSLTRLVADLEQHKLILRRRKDEDRRQSLLQITEAGARLLNEDIRDQRVRLAQVIEKELTPAEQELLRISARLLDHIGERAESQNAFLRKSNRKNIRARR